MKNIYKNKCYSVLDTKSSTCAVMKQHNSNMRGRSQIKFGMTTLFDNGNGFTLIELLVVVLIIGILAAVALPQYQKAVEKSRATQAITLLKSVYNAAKAYQLANSGWPSTFDELAVEIPWTGLTNGIAVGDCKQGKSNTDWSIQIKNIGTSGGSRGIAITRISGPYKGVFFYIPSVPEVAQIKADEMICAEFPGNPSSSYRFKKNTGDYCNKIMKAPRVHTSSDGYINYFRMP